MGDSATSPAHGVSCPICLACFPCEAEAAGVPWYVTPAQCSGECEYWDVLLLGLASVDDSKPYRCNRTCVPGVDTDGKLTQKRTP